jgi:hypothetical protein
MSSSKTASKVTTTRKKKTPVKKTPVRKTPVRKTPVKTAKTGRTAKIATKTPPKKTLSERAHAAARNKVSKTTATRAAKKSPSKKLSAKEEARLQKEKEEEEAYLAEKKRNEERHKAINDRLRREREAKAAEAKAKEDALRASITPDAKGVRHCDLIHVKEAMQAVWTDGKAPLLLDPSKRLASFFTYSGDNMYSAKGVFVNIRIQHQPREDVLDNLRRSVVGSLKAGVRFVLNFEDSAADFIENNQSAYNDPEYFPTKDIFTPGAMQDEKKWSQIVRSSEKNGGFFFPNPEFTSAALSYFQEADYEEYLRESLFLDMHGVIVINPP